MIIIFILAVPLNASVLHLFIFKLKFWKSRSNYIFLFNLVLADLLLLICLPVKAYNFIHGERRSENDAVCKAMLFMLFLNRGASIAFLTVTAIDRYFSVVHPGRKNLLRAMKKSPHISIIIWLLLLPLTIPTMLKNFECCNSHKSYNSTEFKDDALIKDIVDSAREVVFFTQILLPFVILVYCTARIVNRLRKKTVGDRAKLRRAVFLVTSVMVVFSLCFLPCTVARMVLLIARVQRWRELSEDIAAEVFDGLMVLSYLDCLLDPLVYCFCSTQFKSLYLTNYFPFLLRESTQFPTSSGEKKILPFGPENSTLLTMTTTASGLRGEADHCNTTTPFTHKVLSWVMIVEFTLALPLNLSVLYIFIFKFRFWRTNSIFLFNIVLADFLLLVCLPAKAWHFQRGLRRSENDAVCKAMLFMLFLNRGASIAFLTVTAIDRYFSVVHQRQRNCLRTLKKSPQMSILIWLLLLPLTVPTMLRTFECCNSHGRVAETTVSDAMDTSREVVFFTQILLPFVILVYCTTRIVQRLRRKTVGDQTKLRRAVFSVSSVVVVFSLCFLPATCARVVLLVVRVNDWQMEENVVVQIYDGLMVVSYLDCLLDPLVYCFCCSGFKKMYVATFCPFLLRLKVANSTTGSGTQTHSSPKTSQET
ncbi:uncharacterized protein FYW47_007268 [Aplochiton taeniatus]